MPQASSLKVALICSIFYTQKEGKIEKEKRKEKENNTKILEEGLCFVCVSLVLALFGFGFSLGLVRFQGWELSCFLSLSLSLSLLLNSVHHHQPPRKSTNHYYIIQNINPLSIPKFHTKPIFSSGSCQFFQQSTTQTMGGAKNWTARNQGRYNYWS